MIIPIILFFSTLLPAIALGEDVNADNKPNFIVILTDDQDLRLNSMDYMPGVKHYLTDQGTYFNRHYATVSLCCPSRASMWTGKAAHNTNITDLHPPWGMYASYLVLYIGLCGDLDSWNYYRRIFQVYQGRIQQKMATRLDEKCRVQDILDWKNYERPYVRKLERWSGSAGP